MIFFWMNKKMFLLFVHFQMKDSFFWPFVVQKTVSFRHWGGGVVDACQDGLGRTFCVVFFLAMSKEMERLLSRYLLKVQDVVSHIYCLQVLFFFRILIVAPFTQLDNISWRLRELFQLYIFGNIYKEFRRLSNSIINIKSVLQNILLGGIAVVWYMIYYISWLIGSNLVIYLLKQLHSSLF